MSGWITVRRVLVVASCTATTATGCAFDGLNSLPLPGTVGQGEGASAYHVEIANVGTLESNSPVMINDVVVGSVGKMEVVGWHATVEVSVESGAVVPANAVASVGQTSLLGSMHLQLNPPPGEAPQGRLQPGSTIRLNRSSTYPSTEQTLASLSAVVNAGGLGQFGDIIHNFNTALSGRQGAVRDLLHRLDTFVGTLDDQRDNIIASVQGLDRLSATFAGERDVITHALRTIPTALDVLVRERPRITTALDKLRVFSNTATAVITSTQDDLVENLRNLEPTIKALADLGPDLDTIIAALPTYPLNQNIIDRGVRGDYFNLFQQIDLTIPSLKRSLFLGTRFGDENAQLVPAPGEPYDLNYTYNPLGVGVAPAPPAAPISPPSGSEQPEGTPQAAGAAPAPPTDNEPVLPVNPPLAPGASLNPDSSSPPSNSTSSSIFAGPYGNSSSPTSEMPLTPGGR